MAPYKILKQGYMSKEPPASKRGLRKKLHRYWFVLVEDKRQVALVYFKNEDSYIARHRNEGFIRLDDCESISVIGEYFGHKHAFVVKTPRADYHLVPESRYDLHEWIFTLHNSLEAFKKKQRKARERHEHRQRANTADSSVSRPSTGGASGTTPPRTPTRRAPPPPSSGGASAPASRSPRRKPVRPAPLAPGGRNRRSQEPSPTTPPIGHCVVETPPPDYSESMPQILSQEGYSVSTLGSDIHPVMDLDISQTDHDLHHHYHHQEHVVEIQPVHTRSASDSLVLHQQNSSSLPDLVKHEDSSSPDDLTNGDQPSSQEEAGQLDPSAGQPLTFQPSPRLRHTRHLSLISGSGVGVVKPHSRRKKAKRNGSIKLRSRSPPNLPPPPPPGDHDEQSDTTTTGMTSSSTDTTQQEQVQPVPDELTTNKPSSTSLGFSEVMNTISNIDEQLDMINDGFSPKPNVPVPERTTEEEPTSFTFQPIAQSNLSPEYNSGDTEEVVVNFPEEDEEEWSSGDHTHHFPSMERTTPEGVEMYPQDHDDLGPSPQMMPEPQHQQLGVVSSPEVGDTITTATNDQQQKSGKGKHRVMFKEEVEDIPSYDPAMEQELTPEEEIPTGVAALKKKLFGDQESEVARYKRDGILSPKYTHPENMVFDQGYEFHKESSPFYHEDSPNLNNNNSEGPSVEERRVNLGGEERSRAENLYDDPWDQKPASKFKVIGVRKRAGKKERTPPPANEGSAQRLSGEVMMSEVPQPGSTELRNVQSLERARKTAHSYSLDRPNKRETTPRTSSATGGGDSLLASISSTLQARSRYGSDSFLSNAEEADQPPKKKEVRISSRGELEKIKAAHRRDSGSTTTTTATTTATARPGPSHITPPSHTSLPHIAQPHMSHGYSAKQAKPTGMNGHPRLTKSMDELQQTNLNTRVTYDANTKSHILRSLV